MHCINTTADELTGDGGSNLHQLHSSVVHRSAETVTFSVTYILT